MGVVKKSGLTNRHSGIIIQALNLEKEIDEKGDFVIDETAKRCEECYQQLPEEVKYLWRKI